MVPYVFVKKKNPNTIIIQLFKMCPSKKGGNPKCIKERGIIRTEKVSIAIKREANNLKTRKL